MQSKNQLPKNLTQKSPPRDTDWVDLVYQTNSCDQLEQTFQVRYQKHFSVELCARYALLLSMVSCFMIHLMAWNFSDLFTYFSNWTMLF